MKTKTFFLLAVFIAVMMNGAAFSQESYSNQEVTLGRESEADVLYNAMKMASEKVLNLPGLAKSKKIAVMIIREADKTGSIFDLSSKYSRGFNMNALNPLGWMLEALFEPSQVVVDEKGEAPLGEHGFSHSPMFEDLIINALVQNGQFEVVESTGYYRGPLPEIMLKDSSMEDLLKDPETAATIGKMLGVDTVVIGSVGVSQSKRIQKHKLFFDTQFFMANFRLNLRTVDVKTNRITSADTYYGADVVKTFKGFRITMQETLILGLIWYIATDD